ncbi:hypothetical protein [Nostoc favosum]|uniref:Ferritin-like domain-containing protein n=1 Tax=Nostoc favosum CHAB5714 TaxID=2780399 RepID=A0ABS8IGA1_9NOSO|nr:hypothetical protein [Nostoc favosum]MCC5603265.1 hypothetical protein [Nostoc favosum CHAB5714]
MKLERWLTQEFFQAICKSPDARVWYQNFLFVLEADGEIPGINNVTGKLDDDWLESRLNKHMADEHRHSEMWKKLLISQGKFHPEEVPSWTNTVKAFCSAGWTSVTEKFSRGESVHQVELIPLFAGVHALETFAIQRFTLMANLLKPVDPAASELLKIIINDEQSHAAYTKQAVERLGKKMDCSEYAAKCLDKGLQSYRWYCLSLMPRLVGILQKKEAKFSKPFLIFTNIISWYSKFHKFLSPPPPLPTSVSSIIQA